MKRIEIRKANLSYDESNQDVGKFKSNSEVGEFIFDDDDETDTVPLAAENRNIIGEHYVDIDARNVIAARTRILFINKWKKSNLAESSISYIYGTG